MVVLALAAIAAGCSSSGKRADTSAGLASAATEVAGVTGTQRLERLAKLAHAEGGELTLYTSSAEEVASQIVDEFESAFDVHVALYRARDETLVTRLEEEHNAGFAGADAVLTNGIAMTRLHGEGVLAPWTVDASGLLPGTAHAGWVASSFQRFVAAWRVGTRPPTTWEDFADDRFAGKIAIEEGDYGWYATLRDYWLAHGKTAAEADALFAAIARNAKVVRGHSLMLELVASGEVDASTSNFEHLVARKIAEGAPIAWRPAVEPTILSPDGIGIDTDASHPATAALFVEWALTKAGQQAFAHAGYVSARADAQQAAGLEAIPVDVEKLAAEETSLRATWEKITRGGTAVEG